MEKKEIKQQMQRAMATIAKNSFNKETRSFNVVFATETPVQSFNWDIGSYLEIISCDAANIRMQRSMNGLPVFDKHYPTNAMVQLGRASNIEFKDKQGLATITLGARADDALISDIENGIIDGISVGYNVFAMRLESNIEGQLPVYRVTDWEPAEISFAPIQADPNSRIRSQENENGHSVIIEYSPINKRNMTEEEKKALAENEAADKARSEKEAADKARSLENKPQPDPVDVSKIRSEATEAQKTRLDLILKSTRAAKLSDTDAIEYFNSAETIDSIRQSVIEKFVKGDQKVNNVNVGVDQSDKVRSAMEGALGHRVGIDKILTPESKEFRGMSLLRMAEESLNINGVNTRGMSPRQIAETALGLNSREMSRSDFPLILGSNVNRVLLASYEQAPRTFMPFCQKGNAKDFRQMSRLKLSGLMDSFEEVKEGGEYKQSSLAESGETYQVAKFGRKIAITWETIINDDLSAFTRIPQAIAAKAAQKQSDIIWAIVTGNPLMADGLAIFENTKHNNLAASAAAISVVSLAAARASMRKQKGLEGDFLNITPSFLIVGPDLELVANQFTSLNYVATKNGDINPNFNTSLSVIVEPRLTGTQWYLAAAPGGIDTIEYAFLDGEGELFTEQHVGFDVDGLEIKARMVFGAKAIDYRGLYKNAGA